MALCWMSEALPLAVTALLPIVLAPLLGLAAVRGVTASYAHPLIFLFLGGFVLGLAIQRWGLHERIALWILRAIGGTPASEIAGFMLATAFLSMWVSNTATAIMMLPIALSVIALRGSGGGEKVNAHYGPALLLALAYSASIGGMATLIGTPPNALLAAFMSQQYGVEIGFGQWLVVGLPVALLMLLLSWLWLARMVRTENSSAGNHRQHFAQRLQQLGPMSTMEKRVAVVFALTALAWVTRPLLAQCLPQGAISDAGIAIASVVLLHVLPAGDASQNRLMNWDVAKTLPWGILLLFGGGLALAGIVQSSGLADAIAGALAVLAQWPALLIVAAVVLTIVMLTEITSNTATTAAFLPLLGALALALNLPPMVLAAPAAIAASCAFMLPVATPPNAIVFSSGELRIAQMARAGLALNVAGVVVVTAAGMAILWLGLLGG